MYKKFFGLRERPFSKTPDPRYLFMSKAHREGLIRLLFAVEERDLILFTGEIGCGKTTLSRALIDELSEDCYKVILVINPRLTPMEFLRGLATRLGVDNPPASKPDLLDAIGSALYQLYSEGVCPVLIIDEAQLIPYRETFDEIRLLTNFQLDDRNLISVILMGQPELRKRLANRIYEPLRQRVGMQFNLGPLSLDETLEYLDFRTTKAGGKESLFLPEAAEKIHYFSGGIPRKINHAASLSLLEGYGRGINPISCNVVDGIMDELLSLV